MAPETEWQPITERALLVVEGTHEKAFFAALLKSEGMRWVQVLPIGGKTLLKPSLPVLLGDDGFVELASSGAPISLGIVRDADDDPGAAFQSVCGALEAAGMPVPPEPRQPAGGTITLPDGETQGALRVVVFIVPGAASPGAIEDLCVASVSDKPEFVCVERLRACLEEKDILRATSATLGKAMAHAYLATQEDPDKHMGNAAQAGYWNLASPVFHDLKQFLHLLAQDVER